MEMPVAPVDIIELSGVDAFNLVWEREFIGRPEDEVRRIEWEFRSSRPCFAAFIDMTLLSVGGVIPTTLLADSAYLWIYTTPLVAKHRVLFTKASLVYLHKVLDLYPLLYGSCRLDSPRSQRWLRWLGATFFPPQGDLVPFELRRP